MKQDYPKSKIEILIIDGGSSDRTVEVAMNFGVDKILYNRLRTAEAGKTIGVDASKNEIIGFIDSDNILPSSEWLSNMIKPFEDEEIIGTEPLFYTLRRRDPLITRYCALMGMNDVLCLFLRNYDRYNYLSGKWHELKFGIVDKGNYLLVIMDKNNIPTMGANGFLIRAKYVKKTNYRPFLFDIDMIFQLVESGFTKYAKVKVGIVHLYAVNLRTYVRKTSRRIGDYLYYNELGARKYPWRLNSIGILTFIFYTILFIPLAKDVIKGYSKIPDKAWFFHPLACWLTLGIYGVRILF